ncbi:MAG TPA: vitamin B12 dependent-methionine synthase activation domain-containing protein [Bacteroidales bacterium]|nr:vitamin B12 dependent-methionine synthase activation domain-containing protein [Bacteroidales bacterium]
MRSAQFEFGFGQLNISAAQIESILGCREGESNEGVTEVIHEVFEEAGNISGIKAEYHIYPVISFNDSGKSIALGSEVFQVGKLIFGQLKRSEMIALFLCTAGRWPEEKSRKTMKEGDLLKGYIYDVVGSEIAEASAELMQNSLAGSLADDNLHVTNRSSPGYCGWDVSEQHKLFRILPENFCNIRLTSSALMDPVKSVSGFIGIGEKVRKLPYTCNLCDMENCIYRRGRKE